MRREYQRQLRGSCTITRAVETGTNAIGEPVNTTTTVATDVSCRFSSEGRSQTRTEQGTLDEQPGQLYLPPTVDVQVGDTVTVTDVDTFEVRDVTTQFDRHQTPVGIVCDVEAPA